ncbi:MarR family winged helix-turn-helix transcriptional regulator [Dyella sp. C9]|uniref:MarR family winged helix-turn-helix transcriptional regulator n=1 Tax=Dyella sp. C9 TaxID=2202154 RepID=UPI000DEF93A3|nr:MarR family transcriptional regulator [Dyella sp. C9]
MSRRATGDSEIDNIWQALVSLVWETRGQWRRRVTEVTGLPFSRVRLLRRLVEAPVTLKQLAEMAGYDAPATTVAVNDLEDRGLVARHPHPDNRRAKLVSLTPAGRELIALVHRTVRDDAPPAFQHLTPTDLVHLRRILGKITRDDA